MKNKIMYWVGAIATMFPVFLFPIPWWASLLIVFGVYILASFTIITSTVVQAALWIIGGVVLFSNSFDTWVYIVAVIAFVYWLIMNIAFLYTYFKKNQQEKRA